MLTRCWSDIEPSVLIGVPALSVTTDPSVMTIIIFFNVGTLKKTEKIY